MAVVVGRSPGLGDLIVCDFGRELAALVARQEPRPIFLRAELRHLAQADRATWEAVILVKTVFRGALVTAHVRRRKRKKLRWQSHGWGSFEV